jgi:hypothetical protein
VRTFEFVGQIPCLFRRLVDDDREDEASILRLSRCTADGPVPLFPEKALARVRAPAGLPIDLLVDSYKSTLHFKVKANLQEVKCLLKKSYLFD